MTITRSKIFSAVVSEQHPTLGFSLPLAVCQLLGEKVLVSIGGKLRSKTPFGNEYGASDEDILALHKKFRVEIDVYLNDSYKHNKETAETALLKFYHFKNLNIKNPEDIKAVIAGDVENEHYERYAIAQTKYVFDAVSWLYSEWSGVQAQAATA